MLKKGINHMSKRGKIMAAIAFILLFGSLALLFFGKNGKTISYGLIGLLISVVYIAILRLIAAYNKAKLRRRAYEDLHEIARNTREKNNI